MVPLLLAGLSLLVNGGQEVYSFLCVPLWEESD